MKLLKVGIAKIIDDCVNVDTLERDPSDAGRAGGPPGGGCDGRGGSGGGSVEGGASAVFIDAGDDYFG
jgi:hypothetical protein